MLVGKHGYFNGILLNNRILDLPTWTLDLPTWNSSWDPKVGARSLGSQNVIALHFDPNLCICPTSRNNWHPISKGQQKCWLKFGRRYSPYKKANINKDRIKTMNWPNFCGFDIDFPYQNPLRSAWHIWLLSQLSFLRFRPVLQVFLDISTSLAPMSGCVRCGHDWNSHQLSNLCIQRGFKKKTWYHFWDL